MKKRTDKNILIAFILNLSFSIFELVGGAITNSVAITSDAIHDFGDAVSIGISYFLEKISRKKHNDKYTYGYLRFSVLGGLITTLILLLGSCFVIYNAVNRIITPQEISYNGMIIFAIVGIIINSIAAHFTKEGNSLNQKSVNLHMLEDVLGWFVVLIGAILMKFTDISIIDPILSIIVAAFIFKEAFGNLTEIVDLFLIKTPKNIDIDEIKHHISEIKGVENIHHIHIWSIDGFNNCATMHVVSDGTNKNLKKEVKEELKEHGIIHTTLELEDIDEKCEKIECSIDNELLTEHHHHHHHHH